MRSRSRAGSRRPPTCASISAGPCTPARRHTGALSRIGPPAEATAALCPVDAEQPMSHRKPERSHEENVMDLPPAAALDQQLDARTRVDCFVGIPIDSSGAFAGCERMPAAMRAAGLAAALGATDLGNAQVALADPVRDPGSGIIGLSSLVAASDVIRAATRTLLAGGRRPLLIGGCCSLLIGVAAGLADVSPGTGLAFIDGHLDFYSGASSPTGEAADMELAVILGIGPADLTGLTGQQRLMDPAAIVH